MITQKLSNTSGRKAIIMAGGLGSRLGELSGGIPKPLLEIEGKPILEHSILHLNKFGFNSFVLSIKYKAELIKEYFRSGERWGIEISYIEEPDDFLGTAGPLALLRDKPDNPFLLINGDILTTLNFDSLWQHHLEQRAVATMCVREHVTRYPYGIVESDRGKLIAINEKPTFSHMINAGIYVLNPSVVGYIPPYEYLDMTDLLQIMMENALQPSVYVINENWIDIGTPEDFHKARSLFVHSMSTHAS